MDIFTAEETDRIEWDGYVNKSPRATFYHQWGWKRVVENSLGHQALYLAAKEDGIFRGILPLFLVRPPFRKPFLLSVPGANYGGICADDKDVSSLLLKRAQEITAVSGASYLELREFFPSGYDLPRNPSWLTILIPLKPDPEQVWRRLRKSVRHTVRKALRAGVKISIGPAHMDHIDNMPDSMNDIHRFHDLYSRNMKRLGSPCLSPVFFECILREFPDTGRIVWALLGKRTVAADLIVFFKDRIISLYAGTDQNCLSLGTNSLLTWEEIRYGCEKGFRYYDFGRCSRGSGSFDFKKRWNGEQHPLSYYYSLEKGQNMPDKNPLSQRYRLASAVWRRLPLPFTQYLGPHLVRFLH